MVTKMYKIITFALVVFLSHPVNSGQVIKGTNQNEVDFINSVPIEYFLDILVNGLSSMAPMPLDSSTTLMNSLRHKNTLIVNYQFDENKFKRELLNSTPNQLPQRYLIRMFNSKEYDSFYRDFFWEIQKNRLCSNAGLSQALKRGANVIYSYADKNNNELFSLTYDESDCSKEVIPLEALWQAFLIDYMKKYNPY